MKLFSLLPKRLIHLACNSPGKPPAALRQDPHGLADPPRPRRPPRPRAVGESVPKTPAASQTPTASCRG